MTLREYQETVARAGSILLVPKQAIDLAQSLSSSVAEIENYLRAVLFHDRNYTPGVALEELGNVLRWTASLAYILGFDLQRVADESAYILKKSYPQKFDNIS